MRLDGTINAGGNVRGRANGKLAFDGLVGAAAGGFVGVGISVLVGAVAEQTDARIGSTASISAGGDVSIKAEQTSTTHAFGFAGSGGLVGVGGQVVVLSDSSTQHAHVDGGAVVKKALGTLEVKASSTRRVDAFAVGGAIGGVAAGAAIAIATIGGSTTAMIGDSCGGACTAQVSIGLAGDEVHNVSVTAQFTQLTRSPQARQATELENPRRLSSSSGRCRYWSITPGKAGSRPLPIPTTPPGWKNCSSSFFP